VYLAPGGASPLGFRYVDLFGPLAGSGGAVGAALFAPDGVYLGVTARHPALLALRSAPPAPGLDPAPGDLVDLELDLMPAVGTAGQGRATPVAVDALALHAGLLHVATAAGVARATVPVPGPWSAAPGDWLDVTPTAPEWSAHASAPARADAEITPAARAVAALVAADGSLLAARNTVAGPQLWRCDPERTDPAATCEAGDWRLVARDGDGALSRLGRADLGPVTLLAAGSGSVVLGYDSPRGVQLFRAPAASPLRAEDFRGLAGCSAPAAGCEGLSGPGLGRGARLPHVLDGGALSPAGAPAVYLVVGDGVAPARVCRVPLEGT
jgi:hypothetical protein